MGEAGQAPEHPRIDDNSAIKLTRSQFLRAPRTDLHVGAGLRALVGRRASWLRRDHAARGWARQSMPWTSALEALYVFLD